MAKIKKIVGCAAVLSYLIAAVLLFKSLPFWEAAVLDFVLTLLLLGVFVLLYRKEAEPGGAWDYIKKGQRWWE